MRNLTLCLALTACAGGDKANSDDTDTNATDTDVTDTDSRDTDTTDTDVTDTDVPDCVVSFAGPAPMVWFSFEDAGSATLSDSANDYDGEAAGSVSATAGKAGNGAVFGGASDAISASPQFVADAFTWAGWVRMDSAPVQFAAVAGLGGGPESYTGWLIVLTADGTPTLFTEGGTSETEVGTASNTALTAGTWTHLAATFDAGHVELYLNGVSVGSADVAYESMVGGSNGYWLGSDPNNDSRQLSGALDEVGYWGEALSASEIQGLVADGACGLSSI